MIFFIYFFKAAPRNDAKEKLRLRFIHSKKRRDGNGGREFRPGVAGTRRGRRRWGRGNMRKKYSEEARQRAGNTRVSLVTYGAAVMGFMDLYKTLF